jgi:hypothetical protein
MAQIQNIKLMNLGESLGPKKLKKKTSKKNLFRINRYGIIITIGIVVVIMYHIVPKPESFEIMDYQSEIYLSFIISSTMLGGTVPWDN